MQERTEGEAVFRGYDWQNISLEASKIEGIAKTYPEEIRDDFIWLAWYVRERCAKNLDLLVHQIRGYGFKTDKTTISRILRGLYNKDAEGNETKHPLVSARNFNQLVDALRKETSRAELQGRIPFIETSTYELVRDYIDTKRLPENVCKFGLIIGPTGSQKTECTKWYQHMNNSGRVVRLEAPEKATMGRFIRELAKAYGIAEKYAGERLRMKISENVTAAKCIIIDNIQRLYKDRHGWQQEIFSYLQKLQDDTGCTIIMIAVPEFELTLRTGRDRGFFEQFEGRVGGEREFLTLPEFAPRDDVLQIASAFGFKDAEKHLETLEKIAQERGRIRILFNALQKGKRLADAKGEKLTIGHLRRARNEE